MIRLQKNARNLTSQKVRNDVVVYLKSLENTLSQYNKAQLFVDSSDLDGNPIGFYSTATELITNGKKKAGQPFNLFDKGDFLGKLYAKVERDSIFFDTKDSKKQEVVSKLLSNNIFGLTDENVQKTIELLKGFIVEYFKKELLK